MEEKKKPYEILVIDDDQNILDLLRAVFQKKEARNEFKIFSVLNGELALIELEKEYQGNLDLVLLDYHLGDKDGLQILAEIKSKYPEIPVVMLTADNNQKVAVEAARQGASDFINKPFDHDFLLMVVRRVIARQEQYRRIKEAETDIQAARQASQLKGQFLSSMSHELRTPLNAIVVYIQSLQMKLEAGRLNDERLKEALETMDKSGKLLAELIEDVLDFSRIESGKKQVNICAVNLGQVIDNLGFALRNSAEAKGLTLEVEVPVDFPLVVADPKLLKQVLVNLIGNAIKFTDTGKIVVAAELIPEDEKNVKILVRDVGIGISKRFQEKIFGDFFQTDEERKGTGLGLAIAYKLVRLMNGEILVESEVGKGSTFFFIMKKE